MRLAKPLSLGLILSAFAASCVQILGDEPYTAEEQVPPRPCQTAVDCEDNNPCTVESCGDTNVCVYSNKPDGTLDIQDPGDCVRIECYDGTAIVSQDPADIPNDNEPCTTDTCDGSMPQNVPIADNSACQRGNQSGTCQMGVCKIACSAQNPCDDLNPCTTDACDSGTSTCVFTNIDGSPTPGVVQILGDCKAQLCIAGKDTAVNDDADLPDDGNSCTEDLCNAGMPSNVGTVSGTYCMAGSPDVCDGMGKCVECTLPEHCTGITETECTKRECDLATNTCKPKYLGNETTAFTQVSGDCQRNVCNGTDGGTVSIADDTDKPNDSNACTTDSCSNGQKVFTNVAQGTSCGAPKICNANGQCVGCNVGADCPGTDDFCRQRTCVSNVCGVAYTANNTPLPAASQTSMDCKAVVCDGAGATKIIADTMDLPPSDNNQCTQDACTAQGNASYNNLPLNTACSQNGGDVCNGNGACKKSNGKNCAMANECVSTVCVDTVCCNNGCTSTCRACNVAGSLGICTNVPKNTDDAPSCINASTCDGNGNCKKEDGQGCALSADCVNGFCVDGICCENACTTQCKACNVPGNFGKCVNTPSGQTDTNSVPACSGSNTCDGAGVCRKVNGQSCANAAECLNGFCVDGYCCENSCTASCKSCGVPGMLGFCGNIPLGQDDFNASMTCTGLDSCDGMGTCKGDIGQTCFMGAMCINNTCVDGYCCNSICSTTCQACNVAGKVGTCSNVPSGQDDPPFCSSFTQSCDGAGNCKNDNGQSCANGADCLSGNCVDGVCCDTTCSGTCKACNNPGSLGTCTNVFSGQTDNTCMMTGQVCDGSGGCKKTNGQACAIGSDCINGFCVDGVCCNNSCNGTCEACNVAGNLGICTPVAMNGTDNSPACNGTQACDGVGNCKLAIGQDCSAGGSASCASGNCINNMGIKTCEP